MSERYVLKLVIVEDDDGWDELVGEIDSWDLPSGSGEHSLGGIYVVDEHGPRTTVITVKNLAMTVE